MNVDDATPTYRGYRKQALYALFRLFDDSLPQGAVLHPEGKEDLAIYNTEGKLIEIVQVKDHSSNLSVSSFKASFFARIIPYCSDESCTTVQIASYGPIGPDLLNAKSGEDRATIRVLKTLTTHRSKNEETSEVEVLPRLSDADAKKIIKHIKLQHVDEEVLQKSVIAALRKTLTGVNASDAFDHLMWWLVNASEAKVKIDRLKAISKIEQISKFLSERAAYHDLWHSLIVPISPCSDDVQSASAKEEFFRGGRVRFEHINRNLDVIRDGLLTRIDEGFNSASVVILHSASGQGKTTLSYRYAKEFAPSDFRLEVHPSSDLNQARRVALALSGHAVALEVPTLVYLDVRPGDNFWVEIVRELSSVNGIRILVSIREEDWTRVPITSADFLYTEVQLKLEKAEAETIYGRLGERIDHTRHLDFEDAWSQFGERKTLFEFVYYITQEESLAARVTSQVRALQDSVTRGERHKSEIELLLLVSISSAYEARLDLKKLLECCAVPVPQRTMERFNDEYLIRVSQDGRYVEGYHSIRSEMIATTLTDEIAEPWAEAAAKVLPLIVDDDIQSFLLCVFSRKSSTSKSRLIAALDRFHPNSWVGAHGVAMALLWNGAKEYAEQNSLLLEEVFQKAHSGWFYVLDWDLAQISKNSDISFLDTLAESLPTLSEGVQYARAARARQSDKNLVFSDMRRWLEKCAQPTLPFDDIRNFSAMAELFYWLGHLQVKSTLKEAINGSLIDSAFRTLPVYLFGEFINGIRMCASNIYEEWFTTNREALVANLRQESRILVLQDTQDSVVAHYTIDLDRRSSSLRFRGDSKIQSAKVTIHDLTIERIELLSHIFPGKREYGAIGYGHQMSLFSLPFDDANKPAVLGDHIHARTLTRFNATAIGYAQLKFRPDNWADFFNLLKAIRERVLAAFDDLREAITKTKNASSPEDFSYLKRAVEWDSCFEEMGKMILPKVAVDEWGFVTESTATKGTAFHFERYSGLNRISPVWQATLDYARTVGNFMTASPKCLQVSPYLQSAKTQADKELIISKAVKHGFNENLIRMSITDGFDACIAVTQLQRSINDLVEHRQLIDGDTEFNRREGENFFETIFEWCSFVDADTRSQLREQAVKARTRSQKTKRKNDLKQVLVPTKHRIERALKSLRKQGVKAELLSKDVYWKDSEALWITYDTAHPLESVFALQLICEKLVTALEPDRSKVVRVKAIELLWSSIILVPLVAGKSMEGRAFTRIKNAIFADLAISNQNSSQFIPDEIPEEVWSQLHLKRWDLNANCKVFADFVNTYYSLIEHVEHIADFNRLSVDLDELGISIFQSYLELEIARAQPLMQKVIDDCAAVIAIINDVAALKDRPNLFWCLTSLIGLDEVILPTKDLSGNFILTVEMVIDWRDRLVAGMGKIHMAHCLWIADSLGFDGPPDSLLEMPPEPEDLEETP